MAGLSQLEVKILKDLFIKFDKDCNGGIDRKEIKAVLQELNIDASAEVSDQMFKDIDQNENGVVSFDEFVKAFVKARFPSADDLMGAFKAIDTNGDGYLTADEMKEGMKAVGQPMSEAGLADMIQAADKDKDGEISYSEFGNMLKA